MEIIFELIGELFIESSVELIFNKKISWWIRFPLIILIISLYLFIFLGLMTLAIITILKHQFIMGIIFFITAILIAYYPCYTTYKYIKAKKSYNKVK
ncbi:MAG: hypothetical protein ACLR9T_09275 [Thomasclavelia sp.]|uniref:hypothetical protein n=1 Tax=Thomasclavelia sp. TaxID=3025757 RepID=UPI0039A2F336